MMKAVSIGEVLWDIIGNKEFLGGAPLNVCANLHRLGDQALLISAVGADARGEAALARMRLLGLDTSGVAVVPDTATGTAEVEHDNAGEPVFVIRRPAAFDSLRLSAERVAKIQHYSPDWLYFGSLIQTVQAMEAQIEALRSALPRTRVFFDMNLRNGHWNRALIERLCHGVSILKLNENEAAILADSEPALSSDGLLEFAQGWATRFGITLICITLGADGCFLYCDGKGELLPGYPADVIDTVGAGDAFAAAFLHAYQAGWSIAECGRFANALGAVVTSKASATPEWDIADALLLSKRR